MLDLAPAAATVHPLPLSEAPRPAPAGWWARISHPDYFRDMLSGDASAHPELLARML